MSNTLPYFISQSKMGQHGSHRPLVFPTIGSAIITFEAKATNDIYVSLFEEEQVDQVYKIFLFYFFFFLNNRKSLFFIF